MTGRLIVRVFALGFVLLLASAATAAAEVHDLGFDADPMGSKITVGSKTYVGAGQTITDQTFRDGLGREVSFKGWNVSGSTKLVENGYKPFKNTADATETFDTMGERVGPNAVRFVISWEGANPTVGTIDYAYLDAIVAQVKSAITNRMYVILDYHQDLYSRHIFKANSWHQGNGAPKYAVRSNLLGAEYCGWICASWAQHQQTDSAVRSAMNDFWYNNTVNGVKVQDAFLSQAQTSLTYIKSKLTADEWNYMLGVDPWNEPFDGGKGSMSAASWENTYVWGFEKRFRTAMDNAGWTDKPEFAELLVYWNSKLSTFAPATGGYNLTEKPGSRYVFNAHFYDQNRLGTSNAAVNNGTYFKNIDEVRSVARFWGSPGFVSEFGMMLNGTGGKDPNRIVNAMHQSLEVSDVNHAKNRYADPYTSLVSGTEWQWDYYWNRHNEYKNFSSTLLTGGDAWNDESYSAIGYVSGALQFNLNATNVQRVYPRRSQGDIMNFYFSNQGVDKANGVMKWAALRPVGNHTEYLRNNRFALKVWQGRNSSAPSEIFLPNSFDPTSTVVITDKVIRIFAGNDITPINTPNEVLLLPDVARRNPAAAGRRLLVWDDADTGEDSNTWHYALVFKKNSGDTFTTAQLQQMQAELNSTIQARKLSPIYLTGTMTNSGYPGETAP